MDAVELRLKRILSALRNVSVPAGLTFRIITGLAVRSAGSLSKAEMDSREYAAVRVESS